jgi:ABC-type sulfate/molybdate transport systems ATPase subunit/ABC-type sulfate transport system permease component
VRTRGISPLVGLSVLLLAYLIVPIIAFVVRFAGQVDGITAQEAQPGGLFASLMVSLETASVATVVIAVLGTPLGYLLARAHGRIRDLTGVLVQLPLAMPPLVAGILLIYLVGPYTLLGQLFHGALTESRVGIVLAQIFVAAPFLIVSARSAFAAVEPSYDDVAATLGHTRLSRFLRVWLPVAAPGIGAGLLLAWLRAFGEFGATVILAYHPYTLPVFTFVQFGSAGLTTTLLPVAAALAAAFLVLTLTGVISQARLPRRRGAHLPPPRSPATGEPGPPLGFDLAARFGDFDLRVAYRPSGRRLALLGASGSGKTITLRLLAGLATGTSTTVRLGGQELSGLPPEARNVGYLPQDSALLPRLPVWRQVTFGVDADPAVGAYWLSHLGIGNLAHRMPEGLSGGQRRRVALARALARQPRLLLLDEPSTGLDTPVRDQLRRELQHLQRETGLTTVLVTHDPGEAALLADDVLIIAEGRLLQAGPRAEVFSHPASPQAARLLGATNLLAGQMRASGELRTGELSIPTNRRDIPAGTRVTWSIHPEHIRINGGDYPAEIIDRVALPAHDDLALLLPGGVELVARTAPHPELVPGSRCSVDLPAHAITIWPADLPSDEAAARRPEAVDITS